MNKKFPLLAKIIPVLITIIIVLLLCLTSKAWRHLDRIAYDQRLKLVDHFGLYQADPSERIVVVGMEEEGILKEKPLIFWYPDIGKFLSRMQEYQAKVVGIDIVPVHSLGQKIKNAAQALSDRRFDKASERLVDELGQQADRSILMPLVGSAAGHHIVQAISGEHLPFYYPLLGFMKNVTLASVGLDPDDDKIIRKQRLSEKGGSPGFAYALYCRSTGKPVVTAGPVYINYHLLRNIPYYSFLDVMAGKTDQKNFAGKTVLLGYFSRSEDIHPTPLSYLSGTMVHAVTLETLFSKNMITEVHNVVWISLLLCLAALGCVASISLNPVKSISAILATVAIYFAANIYFWTKSHILPFFPHILAPVFVFAAIYPFRYIITEQYRRSLRKVFSYYIDSRLLDNLIEENPGNILKGEKKEACVLFLDIRSFSRLSQTCEADQLVGFLNMFFGAITEIIQRHGGFLNKFLGDGLLAFFCIGQNHVADAISASREIIQEICDMNHAGAFKPFIGDWQIRIGIGIHYGQVVMGNVGSEKKMDFTIIGNTVNLASRIEGLTKEHNRPLLLSEAAYEKVKHEFPFDWLGASPVRGFDEPINLYALSEKS